MQFYSLIISLIVFSVGFGQRNPGKLNLKWKTDTMIKAVPLNEFTALMYPDGIPPIDAPSFLTFGEAEDDYFEFEPVIAVEINGEAKAYPLSVLMYHEIVNDSLGGSGITVTYCPLCNSAVVFDRELNFKGEIFHLDFGVSGMLRLSDMVMYDRQTETWWQQFTGEALVGKLMGAELTFIASPVISLEEFYALYPKGRVLAQEIDAKGDLTHEYGKNPYVAYDDLGNEKPRLFFGEVDTRLPAMTRVVAVIVDKKYKVYRHNYIRKKGVLNDQFLSKSVAIFYSEKVVSVLDSAKIEQSKTIGAVNVFESEINGARLTFKKKKDYFIDKETKSKWNMKGECFEGELSGQKMETLPHGSHFAFAMFAFHPDCEIYEE
jgi:Protein of unknown function (DUF3179)